MEPRAAAAAAAHRRVKRAMGLLRAAAASLAPDAGELDLVAELHLEPGQPITDVVAALELARQRHRGALDVIVLAAPASRPASSRDASAVPPIAEDLRDAPDDEAGLLPEWALGEPPGAPDTPPPG